MKRPAFLAGQWYPGTEARCRRAIEVHARDTSPEQGRWKGLIGPHAGWTYSGDTAAQGYRWLANAQPDPSAVDLVILFGAHRGPRGPNTIFVDDAWETPLGDLRTPVPLALQCQRELGLDPEPTHPDRPDNAGELHLPFLKYFFPEAELLMLGVEQSSRAIGIGEDVARRAQAVGRNAVCVGSTDLTHYGNSYGYTPQGSGDEGVPWVRDTNDRGFLDALLQGRLDHALDHARSHRSACCAGAVAACVGAARVLGDPSPAREVAHTLSWDVLPNENFVGYASVLV